MGVGGIKEWLSQESNVVSIWWRSAAGERRRSSRTALRPALLEDGTRTGVSVGSVHILAGAHWFVLLQWGLL